MAAKEPEDHRAIPGGRESNRGARVHRSMLPKDLVLRDDNGEIIESPKLSAEAQVPVILPVDPVRRIARKPAIKATPEVVARPVPKSREEVAGELHTQATISFKDRINKARKDAGLDGDSGLEPRFVDSAEHPNVGYGKYAFILSDELDAFDYLEAFADFKAIPHILGNTKSGFPYQCEAQNLALVILPPDEMQKFIPGYQEMDDNALNGVLRGKRYCAFSTIINRTDAGVSLLLSNLVSRRDAFPMCDTRRIERYNSGLQLVTIPEKNMHAALGLQCLSAAIGQ